MWAVWLLGGIVIGLVLGVLLSKRVIFSMTDAYAEMWHAERKAKVEAKMATDKYEALVERVKGKASEGRQNPSPAAP